MIFKSYSHIENITHRELIKFKKSTLYNPSDVWVVSEKVHGSNFSITYDPETGRLIPAKRTAFLNMENSNFFNFQRVFDKYDFRALINSVKTFYDLDCFNSRITIHGELCGGIYPGMPTLPNVKIVQKEIKYSNDTEFIVYDIRILDAEGNPRYMNYEDVVSLCNECKIPVIPISFKGTLDECLAWSSEHNADMSEIWKIFGMPNEVPNNIREGHVIKPLNSIFMGSSRVIFKDKNEKYKENRGPKNPKPDKLEYSSTMNELYNEICTMICIPRFNNVASKYGEYTIRNFADLMNLMTDDIFEELENDERMKSLSLVEKTQLKKDTIKKVSMFMGTNKKEIF